VSPAPGAIDVKQGERQFARDRLRQQAYAGGARMSTSAGPGQFAVVLQQYRAAAGLSQEELAERAGLSRRGISDLERGERRAPHLTTVRRLADGLGLTNAQRCQLLQSVHPAAVAVAAVDDSSLLPLPVPRTSFIGREHEIAAVIELLGCTRLLTLTGVGGSGKTRLALAVASRVLDAFPHAVWLVDLAPLADADLVPQTVARVFGVRERPGQSTAAALTDFINTRRLLLLLDNCEHLAAACAGLADRLLSACPGLVILATSRAVLEVSGEATWRVPPLTLPGAGDPQSSDALGDFEAVRLFVERARATVPQFALDASNEQTVVAICRRLDGMPLAIELAAARVQLLTPEQIDQRLDHALSLLVTGPRSAPARQQTMRATLDWSYTLLSEAERRLFERVAVFAAGWTLEAAEGICADAADGAAVVLDRLGRLVDHSMVMVQSSSGAVRFRLLEPLRQYAAERLELRGETAAIRDRHSSYYASWAERIGVVSWGPDCSGRRAALERDYENLRATLRWLISSGHAEAAQRLGGLLMAFWQLTGRAGEGLAWLNEMLASPGSASRTTAGVRALIAAGRLATDLGDYRAAHQRLDEAFRLANELADVAGRVEVLNEVAVVALYRREFALARALAEECAALSQTTGQLAMEGLSRHLIAETAFHLGDPDAAALAERAIAVLVEAEFPSVISVAYRVLGMVHFSRDDFAAARAMFERALTAHPSDVVELNRLAILVSLGWVAIQEADLAEAKGWLVQALTLAHTRFGPARLVLALEGLAQLAAADGQPEPAVRLAAAAEALREAHTIRPTPIEHMQLERWLTRARAVLGQHEADEARASGRRLSPQQAVTEALELQVAA
jgi:predicted ATPase/transcriptional regulator with XRE-family HTH domain